MEPEVTSIILLMLLSKVDFPEPDGPIIEINSPFSTSKETSLKASIPFLYLFEIFFILSNINFLSQNIINNFLNIFLKELS